MSGKSARSMWFVLVLGLFPGVATAQESSGNDEVARNLFEAGKAAYNDGNYEDALKFFEQAYDRSKRPALLYNIGQAADRQRNDARALEAFRAYLQALPDAPNRLAVEHRIRALERRQASADGQPAAPAPTPAAAAPTPEQTASAGQTTSTPAELEPTSAEPAQGDAGIASKWWFWTALGAVVVGGVVTTIALTAGDDETNGALVEGDVGGIHQTLVVQ